MMFWSPVLHAGLLPLLAPWCRAYWCNCIRCSADDGTAGTVPLVLQLQQVPLCELLLGARGDPGATLVLANLPGQPPSFLCSAQLGSPLETQLYHCCCGTLRAFGTRHTPGSPPLSNPGVLRECLQWEFSELVGPPGPPGTYGSDQEDCCGDDGSSGSSNDDSDVLSADDPLPEAADRPAADGNGGGGGESPSVAVPAAAGSGDASDDELLSLIYPATDDQPAAAAAAAALPPTTTSGSSAVTQQPPGATTTTTTSSSGSTSVAAAGTSAGCVSKARRRGKSGLSFESMLDDLVVLSFLVRELRWCCE